MAGSLPAVCSCTIVPLFAGIHKKGAGIGPAANILALALAVAGRRPSRAPVPAAQGAAQ
jgi:uncharacterized membrane protein YraQ (UPF0718 family)